MIPAYGRRICFKEREKKVSAGCMCDETQGKNHPFLNYRHTQYFSMIYSALRRKERMLKSVFILAQECQTFASLELMLPFLESQ